MSPDTLGERPPEVNAKANVNPSLAISPPLLVCYIANLEYAPMGWPHAKIHAERALRNLVICGCGVRHIAQETFAFGE